VETETAGGLWNLVGLFSANMVTTLGVAMLEGPYHSIQLLEVLNRAPWRS